MIDDTSIIVRRAFLRSRHLAVMAIEAATLPTSPRCGEHPKPQMATVQNDVRCRRRAIVVTGLTMSGLAGGLVVIARQRQPGVRPGATLCGMCSCHGQSSSTDVSVRLISAWQKIGVEVEHQLEAMSTGSRTRMTKDFDLIVDAYGSSAVGDPDKLLVKFTTGSSNNWGHFGEAVLDTLFQRQPREMNE
jgi:hypothetical protein